MKNKEDIVFNKTVKKDYGIDMQQTLHMIRSHDLVGTMIAKAIERGEFDNLEGTGKPLDLEENPFEPAELHMVHKILKDNGYTPYWMELGKEADALRAKLSKEIDNFKRYTQMVFSEKRSNSALRRYEVKKNEFYAYSRECLVEISKKILDYNLNCPVSQLGRANFDIDDEMNIIIKEIEILIKS